MREINTQPPDFEATFIKTYSLESAVAEDEDMQKRWKFFLKTIKDNTLEFSAVTAEIQTFLEPVFDAIVNENEWQNI